MPEIEVLPPSVTLQPAAVVKLKTKSGSNKNMAQNNNNNNSSKQCSKPAAEVTSAGQLLFPDDAKKSNKIKELRKLVENTDDFVRRADDMFLCRFLNCCDWSVEEAYQRMCKVFKLKRDHPDWFTDKPLAHYKRLLTRNIKFVLDKRDKNGRRIFVSKLGNLDYNSFSATDMAHLDELWCEFMLNDLETQQKGISCLIDMSGYSIKSMRYLTPSNIRIGTQKADLLPVKHMEFHVVNSSAFLNAAVAIVYPMLSKQIKDHVHFHYSNWDSLHAHLGKDALPAEYGGTNGKEFDYEKLYSQLTDLEAHYDSLTRFGYELKPHVDPAKYAKFFQSLERSKNGKRKNKSKDEEGFVEE